MLSKLKGKSCRDQAGAVRTLVISHWNYYNHIFISLLIECLSCAPPPAVQVAVIRAAGTPEQQEWIGCLGDIAERTAGASLSPCIIVIGEVVSLAP